MVLDTSTNLAKDENAVPTPAPRPKGLVSRIYKDASARRRNRVNGTPQSTVNRADQAKRRRKAKPKAPVRLNLTTVPQVSDVEMSNGESSSGSAQPKTYPLHLPRELMRPHYKEVSVDLLRELEPSLAELDLPFIRLSLEAASSDLTRSLRNIKAEIPKDRIPQEMTVETTDMNDFLPTHMLAVFAPPTTAKEDGSSPRRVTVFPTHSLVLLANCANLSKPPDVIPPPPMGETQVVLPVWSICLPVPHFFPPLLTYLYTKQQSSILRSFLPSPPPPDLMTSDEKLRAFAMHLATTFTVQALLKSIHSMNGLWQNVCALGVNDDALWDAMDIVWQTLLTALAIATNNPGLMLSPTSGIHPTASSSTASASS
ncbi:hypothetical protein BDN70DRAFT_795358 [Pholiota conissans]|uniref:Uncharacterized protein n=1 Tax=Pholiota conissans TaxID=109636 RepID=A0A9P6D7G5_9AGAR|nr:hypothetical protein BDN70DRAFT_795358 [Pholiota conissans]